MASQISRRLNRDLPENWKDLLPKYSAKDAPVATRKLSQIFLNKIAPVIPELIGGSADLTGSNLTRWDSAVDFQSVILIVIESYRMTVV